MAARPGVKAQLRCLRGDQCVLLQDLSTLFNDVQAIYVEILQSIDNT